MKSVDFLKSFQKLDPVTTNFSETFFRSWVIFPYLSVEKKDKFWRFRIAVLVGLYMYSYPFSFPDYLLLDQNVYELEGKFELIQSMSSNKNKAKVKRLILEGFSILIHITG